MTTTNMTMTTTLTPGDRVRCRYRGDHIGTLLSIEDPRAWAGTLAFPGTDPDLEAVRAHAERHRESLDRDDRRPVMWDFGRVHWDRDLIRVTIAEAVAGEAGDDGLDHNALLVALDRTPPDYTYALPGGGKKYVFVDGSSIVRYGAGWDVGINDDPECGIQKRSLT